MLVGRRPLATKIKTARLQAGLTQQQLAERIHCSRTVIADYERGRSEPDPERLAAIAAATNVPLTFFLSAPVLLDGEPVRVLLPRQVAEIPATRPGPPKAGSWGMIRPEHWSDRLGAVIWVEVTPESELSREYDPGAVLAITQGNLVPGCRVVVTDGDDLVVGDLVEPPPRWWLVAHGGRMLSDAGRHIIGSVIAVVEPAAAALLAETPRWARQPRGQRRPRAAQEPET
ncbi:MAG: helix-turn-helix transcriptional regulator [Armatimonadetes bacterium]|nr:helix-turn-helix transcriptional regulator [Armatimonadota bacterium]